MKGLIPISALGGLGVLSAFLFPRLFQGIPVYDPTLGLDVGFFVRPGLQFSGANKYQACLLAMNIAVMFCAITIPGEIRKPVRSFLISFLVLLGIVITQFAFLFAGLSFPYSLLNNDKDYTLSNASLALGLARPNGTFSEPSMAGTIMAAVFLGHFALYLKEGKGLLMLVLSIVGVLIVASGATFPAIAVGVLLVLLRYPLMRFPFYIKVRRLKRSSILLGTLALALLSLLIPSVRETLANQVLNKEASISFVSRTSADLYALQLAARTHGIGVGLGSNRPASLLAMIISTMGIAGLALFAAMVFRLFQNPVGQYFWLKWAALGLIVDMAAGVPDISFPLLWIVLALVGRAARAEKENHDPGPLLTPG